MKVSFNSPLNCKVNSIQRQNNNNQTNPISTNNSNIKNQNNFGLYDTSLRYGISFGNNNDQDELQKLRDIASINGCMGHFKLLINSKDKDGNFPVPVEEWKDILNQANSNSLKHFKLLINSKDKDGNFLVPVEEWGHILKHSYSNSLEHFELLMSSKDKDDNFLVPVKKWWSILDRANSDNLKHFELLINSKDKDGNFPVPLNLWWSILRRANSDNLEHFKSLMSSRANDGKFLVPLKEWLDILENSNSNNLEHFKLLMSLKDNDGNFLVPVDEWWRILRRANSDNLEHFKLLINSKDNRGKFPVPVEEWVKKLKKNDEKLFKRLEKQAQKVKKRKQREIRKAASKLFVPIRMAINTDCLHNNQKLTQASQSTPQSAEQVIPEERTTHNTFETNLPCETSDKMQKEIKLLLFKEEKTPEDETEIHNKSLEFAKRVFDAVGIRYKEYIKYKDKWIEVDGKEYNESILHNMANNINNEELENQPRYLEISGYHQPQDTTFEELGIDEDILFRCVVSINGDADFRRSKLTSLNNCECIFGNAIFGNSSIKDFGELNQITGDAILLQCGYDIKNLGKLESICGDLYINGLIDFSNLRYVSGKIYVNEEAEGKLNEHIAALKSNRLKEGRDGYYFLEKGMYFGKKLASDLSQQSRIMALQQASNYKIPIDEVPFKIKYGF